MKKNLFLNKKIGDLIKLKKNQLGQIHQKIQLNQSAHVMRM